VRDTDIYLGATLPPRFDLYLSVELCFPATRCQTVCVRQQGCLRIHQHALNTFATWVSTDNRHVLPARIHDGVFALKPQRAKGRNVQPTECWNEFVVLTHA
jgi:hypothetical protein